MVGNHVCNCKLEAINTHSTISLNLFFLCRQTRVRVEGKIMPIIGNNIHHLSKRASLWGYTLHSESRLSFVAHRRAAFYQPSFKTKAFYVSAIILFLVESSDILNKYFWTKLLLDTNVLELDTTGKLCPSL